jgi:hypothetical protein
MAEWLALCRLVSGYFRPVTARLLVGAPFQ